MTFPSDDKAPMPLIDSKGNQLAINTDYLRKKLFNQITCGDFSNLILLLLTKRETNINCDWRTEPPFAIDEFLKELEKNICNKN